MRKTNQQIKGLHFSEGKQSSQVMHQKSNQKNNKFETESFTKQLYPQLSNPQRSQLRENGSSLGSGVFSQYYTVKQISKANSKSSKNQYQEVSARQLYSKNQPKNAIYDGVNKKSNNELDDDDTDFFSLLNELDRLNISQIIPNKDILLGKSEQKIGSITKKYRDISLTQELDFTNLVKQINRQQKQIKLNQIFAHLTQEEVKSVILGSYINKIFEDQQLVSLHQINEKFISSYRIPTQQRRIFLLFFQQIIQQLELDASMFSPKRLKFKIQQNVKQVIEFSRKIQTHLTSNKRKILMKLSTAYMNVDYIHVEAKKILCRNMTKILKFHKQYKDKLKKLKNPLPIDNENSNSKKQKNNLVRTNSLITQSQNYNQQSLQNRVVTRSQTRKQNQKSELKSQIEKQDWDIKSSEYKSEQNYQTLSERQNYKKPTNHIPYKNTKTCKTEIQQISYKKIKSKQKQKQRQNKSLQKLQEKNFFKKRIVQLEIKNQYTEYIQAKKVIDIDKNVKNSKQSQNYKDQSKVPNNQKQESNQQKSKNLKKLDQQQIKQTKFNAIDSNNNNNIQSKTNNVNTDNDSLSLSLTIANCSKNEENTQNNIKIEKQNKNEQYSKKQINNKNNTDKNNNIIQNNKKQDEQDCEDSEENMSDSDDQSLAQRNAQLLNITRVIDARLLRKQLQIKQEQSSLAWQSQNSSSSNNKQQQSKQQQQIQQIQFHSIQKLVKYTQITPQGQNISIKQKQQPKINGVNLQNNKINVEQNDKQEEQYKKIGIYIKSKLTTQFVQQLQNNMIKYYGSKPQFHVGPRRDMLDFIFQLSKKVTTLRNNKIIKNNNNNKYSDKVVQVGKSIYTYLRSQKITYIEQIYQKHYKGYFPVGQKRQIFDNIKQIIKYYKQNL